MDQKKSVKIIECPRDAMQGILDFIPTELKAKYINALLKVGFDTLDFGSFVSPAAIPQMRDTSEVLSKLDLTDSNTKLLAIVANVRGAENACAFEPITYLGYPFSVSETFQLRNANTTIHKSFDVLKAIHELAVAHRKELVVYISMAFGNPYGDSWNHDIVMRWIDKIINCGIKTISLADTVGLATPVEVSFIYSKTINHFPGVETGVHLHCRPDNWKEKVNAAFNSGCLRFDTAIQGFGGCPMAGDELVGNLATENLISYFKEKKIETGVDKLRFIEALNLSSRVFSSGIPH